MIFKLRPILLTIILLAMVACDSDDPGDPSPAMPSLIINEFMAENDSHDIDGTGETPDWIEIYNSGSEDVDISGWFITDDILKEVSDWYHIPQGPPSIMVPAGGYQVLFANGHPEMGRRYLGFKLSATGETIGLANVAGTISNTLVFEQQTADLSMGRFPDGSSNVAFLTTPTPGESNTGEYGNQPPVVREVILDAPAPLPDTDVNITAEIFDDDGIVSVLLYYKVDDGQWTEVAMNEISKVTNNYSCQVPGQAHGAVVSYYLLVVDSAMVEMVWPEGAPTYAEEFTPSYRLPYSLFINEFMASNASFDVDGSGEFPDWIEIYNPGDSSIDMGGMYVTDDFNFPQKWQIPQSDPAATTIGAGGYLVLFADEQPAMGALHLNIKLSSGGEDIGLFADFGENYILRADGYSYDSATEDISEGRESDGADGWTTFTVPTPGTANSLKSELN